MNEHHCEQEQSVVAALRGGSRDPEILVHARNCPVCSEVMLVTEFLREETNLAQHELNTLPDAALIWRKAQALAREKALARATLPIRITRISAFAVALLAVLWLILESHQPGSWMADLWPRHLLFTSLWSSNLNEPALLLALTSTLICIGLSSWYILRED
ncbi:MAG: hypothetical protein WB683_11900 [Candidatus Sulfotelmatobacter sp.]